MCAMERALLESMLAEGLSLEQMGRRVGRHPSTVSYWLEKHGLEAAHRDKHLARGSVMRDDLASLVDAGRSIAQIASTLGRSKATIRHWLRAYGLETKRAVLRRAQTGAAIEERECPVHGVTAFIARQPSGYRCLKCRSAAVTKKRRRVKLALVQEAGGKCALCGYARSIAALEFHHVDPRQSFSRSAMPVSPGPSSAPGRRRRSACSYVPTAMPRWKLERSCCPRVCLANQPFPK